MWRGAHQERREGTRPWRRQVTGEGLNHRDEQLQSRMTQTHSSFCAARNKRRLPPPPHTMAKWLRLLALVTAAVVATSSPTAEAKTSVVVTRTYTPATRTPSVVATVRPPSEELDDDSDDDVAAAAASSRSVSASDLDSEDDDDDEGKMTHSPPGSLAMVPVPSNIKIGSTAGTKDKIVSTYRNWVGPSIGKPLGPGGRQGVLAQGAHYGYLPVRLRLQH